MKKLLIVDGNSIINRAFYGVRPLTTSTGLHTNAVFGTINIFAKHLEALNPDYCVAAFDLPEPTFRHDMYKEYKAGRRAMPEELSQQFELARESTEILGFTPVSIGGYEADDIIGTLAREAEETGGIETYIVTGDRDALQLIRKNTTVLLETNSGTVKYDTEKFIKTYGISPEQFVEVKSLMGDSSDNIPGVRGIGEKTALKLISQYGSLKELYEQLDNLTLSPSLKKKLDDGRDMVLISGKLAQIECYVPCGIKINDLACGELDKKRAKEFFSELEFAGFIKRFGLERIITAEQTIPQVVTIGAETLGDITEKEIALDFDPSDHSYVIYDGKIVYKYSGEIAPLLELLERSYVVTYDTKQLHKNFTVLNIKGRSFDFDVMLAAYVANSGDSSFEIPRLVIEYLGCVFDERMPRVVYIKRLADVLKGAVEKSGQTDLLVNIEMPLAAVLAEMEMAGFRIDSDGIKEYGERLDSTARELGERIFYLAGGEFNLNSPKQLSEILFSRLGLPNSKKTKTGFSTSAEVLKKLRSYPIVADIFEYRKVAKLKSTYVEGLLKVAGEDSIIHTSFNQTGTATGRLSSAEPNLQNIPIRTELGRELRRFFIPHHSDYILIDADYSQIELRLLANISSDEQMIQDFLSGVDIHTRTAAKVFSVSMDMVTSELRKRAKAVNFGIMYGIGEYSLSQDLNISVAAAKRYIENYLASYPEIDAYLKDTVKRAYKDGYVTTMFERRRYISELKAQNYNMRAFGERVAMNSPIQGSAADIIKIAMINVSKRLKETKVDAKLILQVHDELLIEAHKDCADIAEQIMREEMEGAAHLCVPLTVDISRGNTWFECK